MFILLLWYVYHLPIVSAFHRLHTIIKGDFIFNSTPTPLFSQPDKSPSSTIVLNYIVVFLKECLC